MARGGGGEATKSREKSGSGVRRVSGKARLGSSEWRRPRSPLPKIYMTEGVMLPIVAGAAPLAEIVEVVAVDATSLSDAGILFPADPAGTVTADVALLTVDVLVTMGVTDLTDAGAVPLAVTDMTRCCIGHGWTVVCRPNFALMKTWLWPDWDPGD